MSQNAPHRLKYTHKLFLASVLCAAAWLLPVGAASAVTTVSLRPNVVTETPAPSDWTVVGATSFWEALDDPVNQPQIPTNTDYAKHITKKGRLKVGLATTSLLGRDIVTAKAWYYTPTNKEVLARVVSGETTLASSTAKSPGWHSIAFSPSGLQ